ncbi:MAG: restriction endonuclease subunit S, partial [Candidatus Pacebacteria bacterium]|nr:restriction endonuclease subunit S [Candidatus Paceibacterota bacterium]
MTTFQIKDFAKVKGGKRLSGGFFVQDRRTDHPYIRVTDMEPDKLNVSNIKYLPDGAFEKIKRYTISVTDVYISIAGTIGLVGKIPNFVLGANITENAAK